MQKYWQYFAASFVISFVAFMVLVPEATPAEGEVLAETAQVVTSTPEPTATPTDTPTPTASPTPTPSPSPTPTITPVPVPTATPDVWSPPEMVNLFAQYAGHYGVDQNTLERLANCESHFNPNAQNGDYLGMFQFSTSSWQTNRGRMGLDPNPALRTNVDESIRTAAFVLSQNGTAPWPSCL